MATNDAQQLHLGEHAQPPAARPFITDDRLADMLNSVDLGLTQVLGGLQHIEAIAASMARAVGNALELVRSVRAHLLGEDRG